MDFPRRAERLVPKLKRFNARPDHYTFEGVSFHTAKGYMPHSVFLRLKVSPRFPRLAAWSISAPIAGKLTRLCRDFKPDALLIHSAVLLGAAGKHVARSLNVPFSFIEHDPIDFPAASTLGRYYTSSVKDARAVFSVGTPWYKHLRDTLGIKQARLASNGTVMATQAHLDAPRPARWAGKRIILCVSEYLERKGHTLLLEAFAKTNAPDTLLVIVRPPPDHILALVQQLGIADRVEFLPLMPQQEVLQHMAWADLFALPSWWESFGLVYAEAMSARCPVLLTSDCGMASHITPGVHGWIVPPKQLPPLEAALREALTTADLKQMGRAGRELVISKLTWARNAEHIVAGLRGEQDPDAHR